MCNFAAIMHLCPGTTDACFTGGISATINAVVLIFSASIYSFLAPTHLVLFISAFFFSSKKMFGDVYICGLKASDVIVLF